MSNIEKPKTKITFDIDPEKLKKGSVMSAAEIEELHQQLAPNMAEWVFKLQLKTWIQIRSKELGIPMRLAQIDGDLHMLTDNAASPYASMRFDLYIAGMQRELEWLGYVDPGSLNEDERKDHERRVYCAREQVRAIDRKRVHLGLRATSELLTAQMRSGVKLPSLIDEE